MHWGYWDFPERADGTSADFAAAQERLCRRICDTAGARPGISLLDVGCGFGGTLASLGERFSPIALTGLNLDERQLFRARTLAIPRPGNSVYFIAGDACTLPLASASFDVELAVECAFHFPSRGAFLREAARVLRPGGQLVLSDFVATGAELQGPLPSDMAERVARFYGPGTVATMREYAVLAAAAGLRIASVEDVTWGMMPSWPFAKRVLGRLSGDAVQATEMIEREAREGVGRYVILALQGP